LPPTYMFVGDDKSLSRLSSPMRGDTLLIHGDSSGMTRLNTGTNSPCFIGNRQSTDRRQGNVGVGNLHWNRMDGNSQSTARQYSTRDVASFARDDAAFVETAIDLTTTECRHRQPHLPAEASSFSVCASRQQSGLTADMRRSMLDGWSVSVRDICHQMPESHWPPTGGTDVVDSTMKHLSLRELASHVHEVRPDLHQSSTSSVDCLNQASLTDQSQTPANCSRSAAADSTCRSAAGPRVTWIAIDKNLLCDVVDKMLHSDNALGVWNCHESTFPVPADNCSTKSSSYGASRPAPDNDVMLRTLLSPNSPTPRPEMPRLSLLTSSFHSHRKGDLLKKRSTYSTADFSMGKRRCHDPHSRNVFSFPACAETRNGDNSRSDGNETPDNTAHFPLLKWKSTMLLRMRGETSVTGSRSPLAAAT